MTGMATPACTARRKQASNADEISAGDLFGDLFGLVVEAVAVAAAVAVVDLNIGCRWTSGRCTWMSGRSPSP